jgi:hypothetical protein
MDFVFSLVFLCLMAVLAEAQSDIEGPCFQFPGDSYLHFTPNNFNNSESIHFSLRFKTTQANGVLMYSRGLYGDDEALFISNGLLRYHLFNTSPTGVENYFGGLYEGSESVNLDNWVKVDIYRSWKFVQPPQRQVKQKTGIVVEIDGQQYPHLDYLERSDISLEPTIYLGGYKESLSSTVHNFTGQIKDVFEEKNAYRFENPSLNFQSKVQLDCMEGVQPN